MHRFDGNLRTTSRWAVTALCAVLAAIPAAAQQVRSAAANGDATATPLPGTIVVLQPTAQNQRSLLPPAVSLPAVPPRRDLALIFSEAVPRLVVGHQFTFAVALVAPDGRRTTPDGVRWESTEPAVATVSPTGLVLAKRAGRTMIVATQQGREVRVRMSVLDAPVVAPTLATLELLPATGEVEQGQVLQFALTARLSNGAVAPSVVASYSSSDTLKATISPDGLLRARGLGAVVVTATASGVSTTASLKLVRSPVATISLTPSTIAVTTGDTLAIAAVGKRRDGSVVPASEITLSALRGRFSGTRYIAPSSAGVDTIVASAEAVTVKVGATIASPPPPLVTAGTSIALRVERFDNADSAVLVSNGVPLAPGMLKPADVDKVRLVVGGTEVAARVVALRGWHKDGSLRSILVQFKAPSFTTAYAASLQFGVAPSVRRTEVVAAVGVPVAVALPSSADYLISTGLVGPTIRVDQVNGSDYMNWQNEFMTYGDAHWLTADVNGGANYRGDNYYDRVLNHFAFWVRGGGTKWFYRATRYAVGYTAKEALAWQPHFAQMEGVELHYWLTGDERSLAAIVNQASWMMSAFPTPIISPGGEYLEGRIQARVLMVLSIATELGMSGTQLAPGGVKWNYEQGAKEAVGAIIGSQQPDGRRDGMECGRDFPFMAGLANNALIFYYERLNRDARIPGVIKSNLDYLWQSNWLPGAGAFKYWDAPTPGGRCDVNNSGSVDDAAPDLNLMVVVPYGWYGKTFGNMEYIRRGEEIFHGSTGHTSVYISKQFNQQYYLTYNYLWYRR